MLFLLPAVVFGDWQELGFTDESVGLRIFILIVLPVFFGVVIWHACLAFLWRRMGLTGVVLTLTLFTAIFGFTLLGRTEWIPNVTALTSAMYYKGIPSSVLMSIVGIGCAALAIVIWLRPEDLLRWCPTGKAWDSYRRGRVMKIPGLADRFAEVGAFPAPA